MVQCLSILCNSNHTRCSGYHSEETLEPGQQSDSVFPFFVPVSEPPVFSRPICLSLFIRRRFFLRSVCPTPFFFVAVFLSPVFFLPWLFLFAGRRFCNFFPRCFCGTAGVVILSEPALRGFFSAFSPPMLLNC